MKEKNPAPKVISISKSQRATILRWLKKGAINIRELHSLVNTTIQNMTDEELDAELKRLACNDSESFCEWAMENGYCKKRCQENTR